MTILETEFLVLNKPLRSKLEALAAGVWFLMVIIGGPMCLFLSIYLLFTRVWWIMILYFCWMYYDRETCETGGREIKWFQNLSFWRYVQDYFSERLILASDFNLNPKRNYLFCCFPHGILPLGATCSITFKPNKFRSLYPQFQVKTSVLKLLYSFPFTREMGMALGGISCSADSLFYVLSQPEGGHVVTLYPGGAEEAIYSHPGRYKTVVKKRKGFIKVALRTGAGLVPTVTFGEPDLFRQIQPQLIYKAQIYLKGILGYAPVIFLGRGLFQDFVGFIPRKKQLVTVLGKPIEVVKNENPTDEEIEQLHQKFIQELVNLFDKYKYEYLENPDETILELE